jgi:hypothetical protein
LVSDFLIEVLSLISYLPSDFFDLVQVLVLVLDHLLLQLDLLLISKLLELLIAYKRLLVVGGCHQGIYTCWLTVEVLF